MSVGYFQSPSGRNTARMTLGGEFPTLALSIDEVGANLAKTSLPSVGTEDDRLCPGPRRGFDKSYAPRHVMLYYIL